MGNTLINRTESLEVLQRSQQMIAAASCSLQDHLMGAVAPMPPPPSLQLLQPRPGEVGVVQAQQLLRRNQQQQLQQQQNLLELREHQLTEVSETTTLEMASTSTEEARRSHEEKLMLEIKWQ